MKLSILVFLSLFFLSSVAQKCKIDIKVNGLADTLLYIGHHYSSEKVVVDTLRLDKNGEATLVSEDLLDGGIYLGVTPSHTYFEFLMPDDQIFSLETDTADFIFNMKIKGSKENQAFNEYQKFMMIQQRKLYDLQTRMQNYPDSVPILEPIFDKTQDDNYNSWKKIVKDNPGTLLSKIILSMIEPEVPPKPEGDTNQYYEFYYYKEHYWDNVDLTDDRLLNTPIFYQKLDQYFKTFVIMIPDSVIAEGYRLLEKAKKSYGMTEYIASYMLNFYDNTKYMNMDKVFMSFATQYFLTEKVKVDTTMFLMIKERVIRLAPNLFGQVAKDLKMESNTGEYFSLLQTDAEYTVVYFFEPNCDYCKVETPRLNEISKKYIESGLKVFAVYTQTDKEEWLKYIEDNDLNWINVWDPDHTSEFRYKYYIENTPVIFLLNKDKEIIGKKLSASSLSNILMKEIGF